ncbi:HEAT repeat domain-containing protein [Pseudodesulfovibrio sp. zrk46]|uniref:HEAT repeat domain-containing protein n=1 Tax=Pseudodesulfovibrio sp. zrk46 TaxID=2725288 RepID=UPI0014498288|nr:HEAT repeat domain-containing protein [Pseudodesulfovibrio sp. zrk46]QJB56161.1 HEAT repeat domain-containing protein [Pseudodesulfovibrio sp. zrk46]
MKLVIRHFLQSGKQIFFTALLCLTMAVPAMASASLSTLDSRDLVTRLADDERTVRTAAALELRMYGQDAITFLTTAAHAPDPIQRRGGVAGLTLLPDPVMAMDTLLGALGDFDTATRSIAAHGLALMGCTAARPLATKLADPSPMVQNAAGYALASMRKAAIPALIDTLHSPDQYVRSKAAWLLGRMGHDALRAIPALINTLPADDDRVMHVVAEAIDQIGPDPATTSFHLIQLSNTTVGCLARRIGADAAPTLIRLLTRPGTPLAQIAFRTLASIGPGAKPALRKTIVSGSEGQRIACALLLVEIDPDEVFALPEDVRNTLANVPRGPKK